MVVVGKGWGGEAGSKTEQATMTDAKSLWPIRFCRARLFFKKAKDSTFDEPAVGPSTIATAPSPLICPEDRLGRATRRGGVSRSLET